MSHIVVFLMLLFYVCRTSMLCYVILSVVEQSLAVLCLQFDTSGFLDLLLHVNDW